MAKKAKKAHKTRRALKRNQPAPPVPEPPPIPKIWLSIEHSIRSWTYGSDEYFNVLENIQEIIEGAAGEIPENVKDLLVRAVVEEVLIEGGHDSWGEETLEKFAELIETIAGQAGGKIARAMYEESEHDSRARVLLSYLGNHMSGWY